VAVFYLTNSYNFSIIYLENFTRGDIMKEVWIALMDKAKIFCEIQDGQLTIPKIVTSENNSIIYEVSKYLNSFWSIEAFLPSSQESYLVSRDSVDSYVTVVSKNNWTKKNVLNSASTYLIGCIEFQSLCIQKVVSGGWGSKECLVGLGAFYLQNDDRSVREWARAGLANIISATEKNHLLFDT
jgi:hypothetical protein